MRGERRADALGEQLPDDEDAVEARDPHAHLVADAHGLCGFGAVAADADVAGAEAWDDFAHTILDPRRHDRGDEPPIAFAAHNAKFEQQWCAALTGGTPWICTYRCALRVWPDAPNHQNNTLRYWLKLPADRRRAEPTHRAGPDAYVTAYLLKALLNSASVEQLIHWSAEPALLARCTFGKHRNTLKVSMPFVDTVVWDGAGNLIAGGAFQNNRPPFEGAVVKFSPAEWEKGP